MARPVNFKRVEAHYRAGRAYPSFVGVVVRRLPCAWPSVRDLFTEDGGRGESRAERIRAAQAICETCPIKKECGEWATRTGQTGVWGGREGVGRAIDRKRAKGERINQYA